MSLAIAGVAAVVGIVVALVLHVQLVAMAAEIAINRERERLRVHMIGASHWFSEHPPTSHLIRDIADNIYGVSTVRERWRKEMEKREPEVPS